MLVISVSIAMKRAIDDEVDAIKPAVVLAVDDPLIDIVECQRERLQHRLGAKALKCVAVREIGAAPELVFR